MRPVIRKILFILPAIGLLASVVAGREKPSAPALVEPAARIETRIELDLARLENRSGGEEAKADPFAQRSFAPPQARAPERAAPPPKPTAPPLPFAYLGKVIEDGKLSVFLARGDENLSVSAGDTIGGEYRVDAVTESEIRFTYLPLKTKQSLPL
jgi:hypothetical protein